MTWTILPAGTCRLDGVEEADELLMPVALHAAADDGAVEDVEGGEQRGRAVALVVVRHGAGAALLHAAGRAGCGRAPGSGSSRRPTAPRHGPAGRRRGRRRRAACGTKSGSLESLKRRTRCGAKPCARQMRCTEETLMPAALAMAAPVQWVASCGGSVAVSATTWSMTSWPSGGTRERPGLVAQQARRRLPRRSAPASARRRSSTCPSGA